MSMTWEAELEMFVRHHTRKGSSHEYVRSATRYVKRLGERYNPKSFLDLTAEQIDDWFAELRAGGMKDVSLGTGFGHVRACMRLLNDGETPKSLRRFKVRSKKQWGRVSRVKRKGDLLTDERLELLNTVLLPHWKTALYLVRYSGARPTPVLNLRLRDIEFKTHDGMEFVELAFTKTKTGKFRTVPVANQETVTLLKDYIRLANIQDYLFPSEVTGNQLTAQSFWKALDKARRKVGITARIYPYLARHTRATEIHDMPAGVRDKMMGWESGLMHKNYEHLATDDMRDVVLAREGSESTEVAIRKEVEESLDERVQQAVQVAFTGMLEEQDRRTELIYRRMGETDNPAELRSLGRLMLTEKALASGKLGADARDLAQTGKTRPEFEIVWANSEEEAQAYMSVDKADETLFVHEGKPEDADWQQLARTGGTIRLVFVGSQKAYLEFAKEVEDIFGPPTASVDLPNPDGRDAP